MNKWKYKLNLIPFYHSTDTIVIKGAKVALAMEGLKFPLWEEVCVECEWECLMDNFRAVKTEEDFNEVMIALGDLCDYLRIWVITR